MACVQFWILGGVSFAQPPAATLSRELFRHPPHEARPATYWLWLNGYVNREHIETELRALHDAGIRGVCLFDMGTRGPKGAVPPAGPAFMSDEWVENFAIAMRAAKKLGLDVQLSAASSWDMGGAWINPADASMALYQSELSIDGPASLVERTILPPLPQVDPKLARGQPAFSKIVRVLAVPAETRRPGYDFVYRLDSTRSAKLSHAVLQNIACEDPDRFGPQQLFAKDVSIAISTDASRPSEFREILRTTLPASTEPTRFDLPPVEATYVRVRIINGHNERFDRVQFGEIGLFNSDGFNVLSTHEADSGRDGAELLGYPPALSRGETWSAANLNDGKARGPRDGWSSAGPPPAVIRDLASIVDLTDRVDDAGRLTWEAPAGKWTILCIVCANTGEGMKVPSPGSDGLATDHFSRTATRRHMKHLIERLEQKLGRLGDSALRQLYLASYEVVGLIWTPDFLEQFRQYRGYDMAPYLPALAGCLVVDEETTERFIYDFRKTLGDLLVDAYYGEAVQMAHAAGIGIESEAGGPGPPVHQVPVEALKALGSIDEVRGEFWPKRPLAHRLWVVKETASAAHIYGKRRVHMEAFTSFDHWQDGPFDLKASADRAFCEGANHFVWHTASHQPPEAGQPGWVYHAGTHLNTNLVWWPMVAPFLDYLSRCSYLLQQGRFVGDVCYYYGDQGFNFVPARRVEPGLGFGFEYDVVNRDIILNRLRVADSRLVLPDGSSYEVLVLPDRDDIDLDVLQKLAEFVRQGATIVGPQPKRATGLKDRRQNDAAVRELAGTLWNAAAKTAAGPARAGGRVVEGGRLREVLRERGIGPDLSTPKGPDEDRADYIHRRTDDADIYFVRNRLDTPLQIDLTFRVGKRVPEHWDPATGRVSPVVEYRQTADGVSVGAEFARSGSAFFVFRDAPQDAPGPLDVSRNGQAAPAGAVEVAAWNGKEIEVVVHEAGEYGIKARDGRRAHIKFDQRAAPLEIDGPWDVRFTSGRNAPSAVHFERLTPWSDHSDESIRYYSGIAEYRTSFDIPATWVGGNRRHRLDLGDLWAVAEASLNGQPLGVLWKPPYAADVTSQLRVGANNLVVRVANTWSNRLVGDALGRGGSPVTRTNVEVSGGKRWADVPLLRSGLFGPVRLLSAQTHVVTLE